MQLRLRNQINFNIARWDYLKFAWQKEVDVYKGEKHAEIDKHFSRVHHTEKDKHRKELSEINKIDKNRVKKLLSKYL